MCLSLRRKEGPKRRDNFKPCSLAYEPWFIYGSNFFNNSISIFFASLNRTFMELKCFVSSIYVYPFPVPFLVLLNWYWSFTRVVLEFHLADTGVLLMWY